MYAAITLSEREQVVVAAKQSEHDSTSVRTVAYKALLPAMRAAKDAQRREQEKTRVMDQWLERVNTCKPSRLGRITASFHAAESAYHEAREAASETTLDMTVAAWRVSEAECELLQCEKADLEARLKVALAAGE